MLSLDSCVGAISIALFDKYRCGYNIFRATAALLLGRKGGKDQLCFQHKRLVIEVWLFDFSVNSFLEDRHVRDANHFKHQEEDGDIR